MIFGFIKSHEKRYPIEKMCKVLEVSQSSYYRWKSKIILKRMKKMVQIKEKINTLYFAFKQRYGSPRIPKELNVLGYQISRTTVGKYMKQLGLRSKLSKKFKVTTNSKHSYLILDNISN